MKFSTLFGAQSCKVAHLGDEEMFGRRELRTMLIWHATVVGKRVSRQQFSDVRISSDQAELFLLANNGKLRYMLCTLLVPYKQRISAADPLDCAQ